MNFHMATKTACPKTCRLRPTTATSTGFARKRWSSKAWWVRLRSWNLTHTRCTTRGLTLQWTYENNPRLSLLYWTRQAQQSSNENSRIQFRLTILTKNAWSNTQASQTSEQASKSRSKAYVRCRRKQLPIDHLKKFSTSTTPTLPKWRTSLTAKSSSTLSPTPMIACWISARWSLSTPEPQYLQTPRWVS